MKTPRLLTLVMLLSVCVPLAGRATTYAYVNIDFPGADSSNAWGINSANPTTIVGTGLLGGNATAYRYLDGQYLALSPPSGVQIGAEGINDNNVIVGDTWDATSGFIFDGTSYTFVSPPLAGVDTMEFRDINNASLVTGYLDGPAIAYPLGFIYDPMANSFTYFADPINQIFENSLQTVAHGINSAGQVNGSVFLLRSVTGHTNAYWGFLREPDGTVTKFRVGNDDTRTRARGINDNGVMAGFVDTPGSVSIHGFVGTLAGGFQLLDVDFPTAVNTTIENINNFGQVVGYWSDGTTNSDGTITTHGFYGTPVETPTGTTSQGAYTFSVDVAADTPIFIDPKVALGFEYAIGATGPNFASTRPPIGFGDNKYTILVHGRAFPVVGGELFDFRANGYPDGVAKFRIAGIDDVAKVDPLNMLAFPTQVAFVGAGTFSGTMTPLCVHHPLPPHASPALTRAIGDCIR